MRLFNVKNARKELLKKILTDIKYSAKSGLTQHRFYGSLSDETINELRKLGYGVAKDDTTYADTYNINW
jgi:hypothetical protein